VSQDSADQRAGRAGRVQAGIVVRLWDARDRLRPHREPEIARVDLAATVLEILAWGGDQSDRAADEFCGGRPRRAPAP
jgi:ATP-dependent helicase HrpB